ncbi:MAG TPA: DUF2304 domain-containing protein [Thermoleophilaceae bacterium]|nr:DUF2304 domain-containing protein [Thermoleophilaceae bacterium]
MELRIQLVAVVASGVLLLVVLELVRRRRFLERYAIVWLLSAIVMLGLAIWKGLLSELAKAIGIVYPPNALFVVAFGFVLVLLLHFSLAVSRLSDQTKVLAQRLALLEKRMRDAERRSGEERVGATLHAEDR